MELSKSISLSKFLQSYSFTPQRNSFERKFRLSQLALAFRQSAGLLIVACLVGASLGLWLNALKGDTYVARVAFKVHEPQLDAARSFTSLLESQSQAETEMAVLRSFSAADAVVKAHKTHLSFKPQGSFSVWPVLDWAAQVYAGQPVGGYPGFWSTQGQEVKFAADLPASPEPYSIKALADQSWQISHISDFKLAGANGQMGGNPGKAFGLVWSGSESRQYSLTVQPKAKAIQDMQRALKISSGGEDSSIVEVRLSGNNAQEIQTRLSTLSQWYLEQSRDQAARSAAESLSFVLEELPRARAKVEAIERQLNQSKQTNQVLNPAFEERAALSQQAEAQVALLQLKTQVESMSSVFTAQHPMLITAKQRLATLESQNQVQTRSVQDLPRNQLDVARVTRDLELAQALYRDLMRSKQELEISQAGAKASVAELDPPFAWGPTNPPAILVAAMTAIAALMLVCFWVLLRLALRNHISSIEEAESAGLTSVLAVLPKVAKGRGSLVARSTPLDACVESLKGLRTNFSLERPKINGQARLILVTGPLPHVGKSFTAANLAEVYAEQNERVLLVDADVRRGTLHRYFGLGKARGLREALSGAELVIKTDKHHSNLKLITAGRKTGRTPDVSQAKLMALLVPYLSEFDVIIIDTAPALVTAEALSFDRVDHYVGLCQAGQTSFDQLQAFVNRVARAKIKLSGLILNGYHQSLVGKQAYESQGFGSAYAAYRR